VGEEAAVGVVGRAIGNDPELRGSGPAARGSRLEAPRIWLENNRLIMERQSLCTYIGKEVLGFGL